jgi:hypothetical protein
MSIRIRENLGGLVAATSKTSPIPNIKSQIGKVYGVVLDENTPSKELFNKSGGWGGIGTVFYLEFEQAKNITVDNVKLDTCKVAKPFHASHQNYPLIGELIHLIDAPSPSSQVNNTSGQKYYTGTVNIWNNNQQNSLTDDSLGKTFTEKSDIRGLRSFDGDRIYQGRKGNGIRFGSTVKQRSNINEWSSIGENGDPITILVNGYVTTDSGSSAPNIEEINKEKSSIYLTSTQKLPLQPGASIVNPRVNTVKPSDYVSSQLIFNSDRITLNSKKDEVLLFAKTNIELNSDNIININAGKVAHINSPSIALGTNTDGSYPTEPVLLGGKTYDLLLDLFGALTSLAGSLSAATVATTEGAICVTECNVAGGQLLADVDNLLNKLDTITSEKVYTV